MSFFYDTTAQGLIDALSAGDYETASALAADQQANLEDFLATQTFVNLTGTLDGAGAITLAHNVDLTGSSVLLCQGWYNAGAGQSKPLTLTYVDGTNVVFAGGGAGAAMRATLVVGVGLFTF